jgi:hypothetical protein
MVLTGGGGKEAVMIALVCTVRQRIKTSQLNVRRREMESG